MWPIIGSILALSAGLAADPGPGLGTSKPVPFALQGKVYLLPEHTEKLPDFSRLKPVGSIYTKTLEVNPTSFSSGFPGVTNRFEWFAIDYQGRFYIKDRGKYTFRLTSDDGSRLFLDGNQVIDHDGIHGPSTREATVSLTSGVHSIRVQYFQGPREQIALVLEVAPEGGEFKPFIPPEMVLGESKAVASGGVKLTLRDAILFDYDRSNLKPAAQAALADLKKTVIDLHPNGQIVIEGHTDNRGSESYNLALSQRRAEAVGAWLKSHGVASHRLKCLGRGESTPCASNAEEAGRTRNRRVELLVQ